MASNTWTHDGHTPLPDMSIQRMYLFLSITVRVGYNQRDTLKDYLSTLASVCYPPLWTHNEMGVFHTWADQVQRLLCKT
jgi:hypothetical protein